MKLPAHDTRLNRVVAIKVLSAELRDTPDRRQRFQREARAIAALSHQNICAIFDVGDDHGLGFLVSSTSKAKHSPGL